MKMEISQVHLLSDFQHIPCCYFPREAIYATVVALGVTVVRNGSVASSTMRHEKATKKDVSPRIETIKEHILLNLTKLNDADKIALRHHLDELVDKTRLEILAVPKKLANPAIVGLTAFAVSSMLLQFHNLGWMNMSPVIWVGMIFGGLVQMLAGFMEFCTGNNFCFSAFTTYGAFWVAFALLQLDTTHQLTEQDKALFLLAFTTYTAIMFVASFRDNVALAVVFFLLLLGLILLVFHNFFPDNKAILRAAGGVLLIDAFVVLYVMAHLMYKDKFGRDVLPVGPPIQEWINRKQTVVIHDVERG